MLSQIISNCGYIVQTVLFRNLSETHLLSITKFTVTQNIPLRKMAIIWLRNWFPVQFAFCLPQRLTDSCLKRNEKWQLLFAFFTDSLTHNLSSSSCFQVAHNIFCAISAGNHAERDNEKALKKGQEAFFFLQTLNYCLVFTVEMFGIQMYNKANLLPCGTYVHSCT